MKFLSTIQHYLSNEPHFEQKAAPIRPNSALHHIRVLRTPGGNQYGFFQRRRKKVERQSLFGLTSLFVDMTWDIGIGSAMMLLSWVFLLLNAFVTAAACRTARHSTTFILITAQCINDIWKLLQLAWLATEITLGAGSLLNHRTEFVLYGLGIFTGDGLFVAIAYNRLYMVLWPKKSAKLWTRKFTAQLVAASVLVGAGYAVFCAFGFGMPDDVYIGHLHEFYSFGTTNATLRSTPYYYCLLAANSSATVLSLGSYATILAYMSSTKLTGVSKAVHRRMWKSAEFRLTLTCLASFLPLAGLTLLLILPVPRTQTFFACRTILWILNSSTNSWLLLLFSTDLRKNVPRIF